jgi:hypothetical protein
LWASTIGKEEVVGVHHGAPQPADAAGLGKGAAREAAEDVDEHVVGEADAVGVVVGIHPAGHQVACALGGYDAIWGSNKKTEIMGSAQTFIMGDDLIH